MKRMIVSIVLLVGALLFLLLRSPESESGVRFGERDDLPLLTFYSTPAATTPQLAFWAGVKTGRIGELCRIELRLWRDLEQLQGLLLAGKGDLWLGHTEGFALAHRRGAPVRLLVISGWRKFYLLRNEHGPAGFAELGGRQLAFTPQGSPAVPLLRALLAGRQAPIDFVPHQPAQLSFLLHKGALDAALAPEPLVSTLLAKNPDLRIAASVEELYGRINQGPARFPLAGIAVNAATARRHPTLIQRLLQVLIEEGTALAADPAQALALLPDAFQETLPPEILAASLARDLLLTLPAAQVEDEVARYLGHVAPELIGDPAAPSLPADLLWR